MSKFRNGNYEEALQELPKKETGGFITTLEKNWIGFWDGRSNPEALKKLSHSFDQRKYISVSREASYFFFQESEEGYIPAEHEMVVLHLVTAMSFLQSNKIDAAQVEARRASYLLQGLFRSDQKHFDDPSLRLWLAALWTALGEWDEARVDLRRVWELTQDKKFLRLSEQDRPPQQLQLIFSGVAPDLIWRSSNVPTFEPCSEPTTAPYQYLLQTNESAFFCTDSWFSRHAERNTLIRDSLLKSNYMTQFMGMKAGSGAIKLSASVVSTAIKVTAVIVGTAITGAGLVILFRAGSGDFVSGLITGGILSGVYIWSQANRLDREVDEHIKKNEKETLENLRTYRFVRFLPYKIALSWSENSAITSSRRLSFPLPGKTNKVWWIHDGASQ